MGCPIWEYLRPILSVEKFVYKTYINYFNVELTLYEPLQRPFLLDHKIEIFLKIELESVNI